VSIAERPWLLRGLIVALVAGVAALVLVLTGDEEGDGAVAEAVAPRVVSVEELREQAEGAEEFPIYWAGPMGGTRLELTQGSDGSALLRYLPGGAPVGGAGEQATSVGTYPLANAAAATAGLAAEEGAAVRSGAGDRTVVATQSAPRSAYFAAPGNVQVEVYAPTAKRAMRLATSERVRPVG